MEGLSVSENAALFVLVACRWFSPASWRLWLTVASKLNDTTTREWFFHIVHEHDAVTGLDVVTGRA